MSAPNASPFDLTPPRRPGLDDFNGIAKEDDQEDPPNPREQPNAAEWNTMEWLLLAIGRVMPVAVLSFSGGAVVQLAGAPKDLVIGDLTVTPNGTGDYSITWAAGTFPASNAAPVAALNAGPGMIYAVAITNGVQVKTYNNSGVAANLAFTLQIF